MIIRFVGLLLLIHPYLSSGLTRINANEAVAIGGINQWISIKGVDVTDPVLLFLHGGPGNSAMGYADQFTGELQKHFVVVQWDQRESGTTKKLNTFTAPLTVALFEKDAIDLINYLRARFSKDKIYLVGHSWGGFLGLTVAAKYPELLVCYIAINPMVYQEESERLTLEFMKKKARQAGKKEAMDELSRVQVPFQNGEQLYYHRKWLADWMGTKPYSKSYIESWSTKWLALFNEASHVNFVQAAPEIKCPIYFFIGSKDYQTYFKLAEDYYNRLKADKKALFWFMNSAHLLNLTEPKKLQEIIIYQLLPKLD